MWFITITADTYVKHPNSYLPKYNVNSETDGETTPLNATDVNRNSGESNAFESDDEELDDQIEEEGWCNFSFPIRFRHLANWFYCNFGCFFYLDEEDDDDQDIPAYGFPRNRREPSDIDFIISSAGLSLVFVCASE